MVIQTITRDKPFVELVERLRHERGVTSAAGLWGSSAPMVGALAAESLQRPMLYVTAHLEEADHARDDIEVFVDQTPELLSAFESLPGEGAASDEISAERIRLCCLLRDAGLSKASGPENSAPMMIVAPIQALMQPVPLPEALEANSTVIERGQTRDQQALAAWLSDRGFTRLDMVESPGDFALRGGILDIYPPGDVDPIRIEFFGDDIESIRQFDPSTQRSSREIGRIRLAAMPQAQKLPPKQATSFFTYLPADTLIVFDEPLEIDELGRAIWDRLEQPVGMMPVNAVFRRAGDFSQLHLGRLAGPEGERAIQFEVESVQRFEKKAGEAIEELCDLARDHRVVVFCDNEAERKRFEELLVEKAEGVPESVSSQIGMLHRGFCWRPANLVLVGHHEIFHRYEVRRRFRRAHASRPIESWLDLEPGDHVVHVVHGIARFEGMKTIRKAQSNKSEEFLTLTFAGGTTMHVPVSQIDLVQKYIGAGGLRPTLSTLGGTRWKRTKEKVAEAVDDLAAELLQIQAEREMKSGTAYPADTEWQREFEESFLYTETEDQITVAAEIKSDLMRERPADRLLCGDVGYGKTELALRGAFKVVEYGRQVAVLVPTTVLAEQHYKTFCERLADYPFTIESLSRFRTAKEQADIIARAKKGQIDIVVGTHRLLSRDVGFANLGLVVIDEEQRFGVEHKEKLKRLRSTVDVLTLTATPIPRTLHMAMLGIRDISSLTTPPLDRRSIVTQVRPYDNELIRNAILREMNRDGQVYFLHNRVHNIRSMAEAIHTLVPEARILVGHGQMPAHELEDVMVRFVRHEADVLVCTTIIESGIDIPNVNTIFINRAERFGLSDLHQLRGRVGRYKHRAYCYLLLSPGQTITSTAAKRLKAIEEFSELGAGFRIAMRDLEIRGAGNILGSEQSGHIAAVGYEMYCQLLETAVRRLKNEDVAPMRPVHLELDLAAQIPRSYIPADRSRMEIYRRLVACRTLDDLRQLQQDLVDAFGKYPPVVQVLLDQAELRVLAQQWKIHSIIVRKPDVVFTVEELAAAQGAFAEAPGSVRMADPQTIHVRMKPTYLEPETLLAVLRKMLKGTTGKQESPPKPSGRRERKRA